MTAADAYHAEVRAIERELEREDYPWLYPAETLQAEPEPVTEFNRKGDQAMTWIAVAILAIIGAFEFCAYRGWL